jgi:hypothetical protein
VLTPMVTPHMYQRARRAVDEKTRGRLKQPLPAP